MIRKTFLYCALVIAMAGGVAPASATSLIRASLDDLTATNSTIVVGEVIDSYSYWNADGTFILTDVRVDVSESVKGDVTDGEITVTILGGSVGDLTALIVGGAELVAGNSYVMFLSEENLPGARGVHTFRDHCQGVFDVRIAENGLRAVSQAAGQPLVPDASGRFDAAGGVDGFPLGVMIRSIRERSGRREVRR